jgi:SAM-dependent methyltransferase
LNPARPMEVTVTQVMTKASAKTYSFVYSERCNMCGAGADEQTFLGHRLDSRQGLWPKRKAGITTPIFVCRICRLLYPNPMPIPARLEQHYDVAPEAYWTESYFQSDPNALAGIIAIFSDLTARSPRESTALDIGAGIGKAMAALGRAGFDVAGIEPSPSFRQAAVGRMGIPAERLKLASVENAEFPDDSFDFINFGAVLEHLADPAAALKKTIHWLKPGGVMYVEVPSSAFLLSRLVRLFYRLTGAHYVISTSPMHAPYHLYEFGLESFHRHGIEAGYSVARHAYYPCAGYMPRFLIGPFNWIMKLTRTGMQLAVWLRKDSSPDAYLDRPGKRAARWSWRRGKPG